MLVWFCIRAKLRAHTLRHPCLARSSRCIEPLHPHNLLKAHPSSRLAQSPLPPLSKGGGLTARHKLSLCCILLAIHPPFWFIKLFAVKTEGLLYHPLLSTTSMPPLSKMRCCRPKEFGRLPEGLLSYRTLSVSQTPPLTIPQSQWRKTQFSANASSTFIKSNIENVALHCASSLYTRELKVIVLYQPFQNCTIPRPAPSRLPPLSKVRCCRPKKFGRLPEWLFSYCTLSVSQTPPLTIPQ